MFKLKHLAENPILLPNKENSWEAEAAFNGCPVSDGRGVHFLFRALSTKQKQHDVEMQVSSIGYAYGKDGVHFGQHKQFIIPAHDWEQYGCEDPRVTKIGDKYYIFYTALSKYPFCAEGIKIAVAVTKDFVNIEKHPVTTFNSKAMALFPEKIGGKYVAILTVDTDRPPAKIAIATFTDEKQIWSPEYWDKWYGSLDEHVIPLLRNNFDHVEVGAPPVKTKDGWLVVYSYIQNYLSSPRVFGIETVLLDLDDPTIVLSRVQHPILVPEEKYEKEGMVSDIVFPSGAMIKNNKIYVYYGAADTTCCLATGDLDDLLVEHEENRKLLTEKKEIISKTNKGVLRRFAGNPILAPRPEFAWEAKAVFNPGAVYLDDRVHLVYRAMSKDNTSVMGYASSEDGIHFDERLSTPIYIPIEQFEEKKRPGNSGCEDPRLTVIGNTVYMLYTAYDGIGPPRVAMTSIKVSDFVNHKWKWNKSILISQPGIDNKDSCILSEKINGKYVFFHRIGNSICINLIDKLNLGKDVWLNEQCSIITPRMDKWDNRKIGISAPPIKTKEGWLLLYHGISDPGGIYKLGAMMLHLNDPIKVLYRTNTPILEPKMKYELEGQVNNVVFPCGAVVKDNELYVYYGGADSVVGVAVAEMDAFLKKVKKMS